MFSTLEDLAMDEQRPVIEFYPTSKGIDISSYVHPSERLRDQFQTPFYHCLPLVTANTLGWTVTNRAEFTVSWKGGGRREDVIVEGDDKDWAMSWFGFGTFTIFPHFFVRTPPGVNLLIRPVPNFYKHYIQGLEGFVETDWLTATSTINFRIHMPLVKTTFKKDEPLVQLVPYGRHYVEQFDAKIVDSGEKYEKTMEEFLLWAQKRMQRNTDHSGPALDYVRGEDIHGNTFPDHVKVLKVSPLTPADDQSQETNS